MLVISDTKPYNDEVLRERFFIITTVIFMCLSVALGTLYVRSNQSRSSVKEAQDAYPLLAKRLFLERSGDVLVNLEPLRKEVKAYLAETGLEHSFYFEYLFTGSSVRDGENNKLVGASLMKIPIVMDLYKAAEQGKVDLDKKVKVAMLNDSTGTDARFGNQHHLKPGDEITLREAAKIALTDSDNTAAYTIFEATKDLLPAQDQAITNLDVETQIGEKDQAKYALIDARSYTSFLTCLYFSCFLSRDNSQAILNELTNGADNDRIRAGVPLDVRVARKIGSFSDVTQSDCGIVYVPNRRYTLCVMLDTDAKTADTHIKKISEMVYDYVTTVN